MKENKIIDTNIDTKGSEGNDPKTDTSNTDFSIFVIGASAGGLEAMSAFLGNVPENSGLAFVIVQHMENKSKKILVDLLQGATTMKVVQAYENISVEPDSVYVIPPNKNMSIKNNIIHLFEFTEPHGKQLPINFFFSSLANDKQKSSIGVILS